MNTNMMGILNALSTVNNSSSYRSIGSNYQAGTSFSSTLQNQMANRMKQEIYRRFQIEVGSYNDNFNCYIPSEVLCRMNTDNTLKEKVFNMLEKYSGEEFKETVMEKEPSVKKCTLNFDENGNVTVTLKTSTENQSQTDQNTRLLYQKLFMQQAALMPYQMNLYSGYNLLGLNGLNSYSMLQNSLFSSILGNIV